MSLSLILHSACAPYFVSIVNDREVISICTEDNPRLLAKQFVPMVKEAMNNAQISVLDIDFIVVTRGPGSFTGVRIGLAAAQGLSIATGKPMKGVTTLEVIAYKAFLEIPLILKEKKWVVSVVNASRENDVFAQRFDIVEKRLDGLESLNLGKEDLEKLLENPELVMAGYVPSFLPEISATKIYPFAIDPLSIHRVAEKQSSCEVIMPVYIRPPDAMLNNM